MISRPNVPITICSPRGGSSDGHLLKVGFSSARACEVCRYLLDEIPGLSLGVVMDDVRYTNFDVSVYWKTQTWQFTDFTDVPDGIADKIIIFPSRSNGHI